MTKFTVYGKPETKGSTRAFIRGGRAITTNDNPKTKAWQTLVSWAAQEHRPKEPYRAAAVILSFYFPRPKSVSRKRRPFHTVRPDIDKLTRASLDGLSGIIYTDDAVVTRLEVSKDYGVPTRCEIEVREIATHSPDISKAD